MSILTPIEGGTRMGNINDPKVSISSYYSTKLGRRAYALTVEGTSRKLFLSKDDLADLMDQLVELV